MKMNWQSRNDDSDESEYEIEIEDGNALDV